ncbi:MAG: hypothetical protein ACOX8Q_06295 [Christensenellales bacterium]|jgi:hypothetical protein
MADIAIGIAAGVFAAAMCIIFYRKGVRDGVGMKKRLREPIELPEQDAEGQNELMKKYEMIMNYDPYGEHV